jgi:hypothetical protein
LVVAQKGAKAGSSQRKKSGSGGDKALERLQDSIDAAQAAVKDVRSEMSRGSRELLKDVETTLRDARKNLRRVSRLVSKDLEDVQQAVTGKGAAKRKPAARKPATRKPAPKAGARSRSGGSSGRSAARK